MTAIALVPVWAVVLGISPGLALIVVAAAMLLLDSDPDDRVESLVGKRWPAA